MTELVVLSQAACEYPCPGIKLQLLPHSCSRLHMRSGRAFTHAALLLHRGGLRLGGLAAAYFGVSVMTSVYRNKQVLGMGG